MPTVMSLAIVSCAVADFVESAWLVAATVTVVGEGRSAGAVYTPSAVIVPAEALPAGMPFTLQITLVFVVFVTVAANVCELPRRIDPLVGVTVTVIVGVGGGEGGGSTTDPAAPPQPGSPPAEISRTSSRNERAVSAKLAFPPIHSIFIAICVRGRMPGGMQAKGQRKVQAVLTGRTRIDLSVSSLTYMKIKWLYS